MGGPAELAPTAPVPLWRFYAYFLRLGVAGFGGPIALAGFMQRDLVEECGWISRQDYLDRLALAQLAPGPLAAQLAMYLGYVRAGIVGAAIVSCCFILPSFFMVWAISVAYVHFGALDDWRSDVGEHGFPRKRGRQRSRSAASDGPHISSIWTGSHTVRSSPRLATLRRHCASRSAHASRLRVAFSRPTACRPHSRSADRSCCQGPLGPGTPSR